MKELKRVREGGGTTPIFTERAARLYDMAKHTVLTVSMTDRMLTWRTSATYLSRRRRGKESAQEQVKGIDRAPRCQDVPLEHLAWWFWSPLRLIVRTGMYDAQTFGRLLVDLRLALRIYIQHPDRHLSKCFRLNFFLGLGTKFLGTTIFPSSSPTHGRNRYKWKYGLMTMRIQTHYINLYNLGKVSISTEWPQRGTLAKKSEFWLNGW